MSYSATRLTCFALLSAIEDDLRLAIVAACEGEGLGAVLPSDALAEARRRYRRDAGSAADHAGLSDLLPYVDYQIACDTLSSRLAELPISAQNFVQANISRLQAMTGVRNRVAHTRPLEIDDLPSVMDVATDLSREPSLSAPATAEVLRRLAEEPAYVLGLDIRFANLLPDPTERHNLPVPDFDETGFIGRRALVQTVLRRMRGSYPVISLVGDGGIGKTALALKVAYDILDSPDRPYDAIVWTTAKTSMLTVKEVRRIEGAVVDSLGLLGVAAKQLGGTEALADPLNEVLAYMEHFKVLLILDNLETVLDDRLRSFLSEIPNGSKVLITSRVGFGTLESIRMTSMEQSEGTALLRSLSKQRSVGPLLGADNETIQTYVRRMGAHPLYVKWFVSAVQSGQRPEEVLASDILLDYCMANVYVFLSDNDRMLLRSMQVLPGRHNQAELSYFNQLEVPELQASIMQLLSTNFVSMHSVAVGNAVASEYELTEFASKYLDRHNHVLEEERNWLLDRQAELYEYGFRMKAQTQAEPYNPYNLDIRGPGDFNTDSILVSALSDLYNGRLAQANELVLQAKTLSPDYHECFRVEALIRARAGNLVDSQHSFESALELRSDSAALHFFFADFLLRDALQPQLALDHLQTSARLDPNSPMIAADISFAFTLLRRFEEARDACVAGLNASGAPSDLRTRLLEGFLSSLMAESLERYQAKDADGAVAVLEDIRRVEPQVAALVGDPSVRDRVQHVEQLSKLCVTRCHASYILKIGNDLLDLLEQWLRTFRTSEQERHFGTVVKLVEEKGFAFVKPLTTGQDVFLHCSQVVPNEDWLRVREGADVSFAMGNRKGRPQAMQVWLLS